MMMTSEKLIKFIFDEISENSNKIKIFNLKKYFKNYENEIMESCGPQEELNYEEFKKCINFAQYKFA